MGSFTVSEGEAGVNLSAADIRWTLGEPLPPLERIDLLMFNAGELLACADDLQRETRWLRVLLHECVSRLHVVTGEALRSRVRIQSLLAELRTLLKAGGGQPRTLEEIVRGTRGQAGDTMKKATSGKGRSNDAD